MDEAIILKQCPFCGGNAKVSFRQCDYMGQNVFGDVKVKYRVQIICKRCYSRGKPIKTVWMINPNPKTNREGFSEFIKEAAEAWNRREKKGNGIEKD